MVTLAHEAGVEDGNFGAHTSKKSDPTETGSGPAFPSISSINW